MVDIDKTISFERFFKIWFFIAVSNAQTVPYTVALLFSQKKIATQQIIGQ